MTIQRTYIFRILPLAFFVMVAFPESRGADSQSPFSLEKFLRYHNQTTDFGDVLKRAFILKRITISMSGTPYQFFYRVPAENLSWRNSLGDIIHIKVFNKESLKLKKICERHNKPLLWEFFWDTGACCYPSKQSKAEIFAEWLRRGLAPNANIRYAVLRSKNKRIQAIHYCVECRKILKKLRAWKDSDGDMICDAAEKMMMNDPQVKDFNRDTDKDGYTNLQECRAGTDIMNRYDHPRPKTRFAFCKYWIKTDLDSDGDGFSDYDELMARSAVLDSKSHPPLACFLKFKRVWREVLPIKLLKFMRNKSGVLKIRCAKKENTAWRSFNAKVGDIINTTKGDYKILSGERRTAEIFDKKLGRPISVDRSFVTIKSLSSGGIIKAFINSKIFDPEVCVEFSCDVLPGTSFSGKENSWISIGSKKLGYEKYKIERMNDKFHLIILKTPDDVEYIIKRLHPHSLNGAH